MTELNLLAKPFVSKLQKKFTEQDFIELKQELEHEKERCVKYEKEKLKILHEIKDYVTNVETMKKIHNNEKLVLTIRVSALQDVRDVLYNQITDLHVDLEKLKLQIKTLEKDKIKLQEIIDTVNENIKIIETEKKLLQTEINSIKATYMNIQQQLGQPYYPYYYYSYYQNIHRPN